MKKKCPVCGVECGYWDFICWKCHHSFWWPPVRRVLILVALGLLIGILTRQGLLPDILGFNQT